jgi:mRNA-degrading endonuclease RelE of RelBE toxin-antitoxin system
MNIIKTNFFNSQFNKLKKKFPKILNDLDFFEKNIQFEPYSNLWNWIYKFRIKNSSIPTWKRSWFRIIILFLDKNNIIPLYIYSKNEIENIFIDDIIKAKEIILKELEK